MWGVLKWILSAVAFGIVVIISIGLLPFRLINKVLNEQ